MSPLLLPHMPATHLSFQTDMKEEIDVGELAPMRKTSGNRMHYLDKHSNTLKR